MPTPEERLTHLERAVRLLTRDQATSRALYFSSIADINGRFDDLEARLDERFNAVDQRFDAIDQRFDAMHTDIQALITAVGKMIKP